MISKPNIQMPPITKTIRRRRAARRSWRRRPPGRIDRTVSATPTITSRPNANPRTVPVCQEPMTNLLGLDIGTTGVRCVAIDERGDLVADASEEYPLYTPQPGWSEQRPEEWWEASQRVIASVADRAGRDVSGIGLAGQMHGAVFLDQKDAVIRPALLWNDQRTEAQCQAITERVGARRLTEITGNPALTGFQAPKILWLRDEEPKAYERVAAVLLPKDYIRLKLTGEKATDASDASGTLLLDLKARTWSNEILQSLDIPAHWLPKVHESPEPTGEVTNDITPHLDPRARGAFFGLTSRHGLGHLTRAVMEGVAYSLRDSLEIIVALGADPQQIRVTGGGGRSSFWRQLLADVLGRPIVRTIADEGPAYGAALLAGVASGVFGSIEEACAGISLQPDVCEPTKDRRTYDQD